VANRYFTKAIFDYLGDLKANNDRAWFEANKARYEEVLKAPALRFIADFGPELAKISPHFKATPRSLYRIHRDVRFSKDKSPFKTQAGLHFRHDRAKDAHAPGYYLHIEPGQIFLGIGLWQPESQPLRQIRERIVEDPAAWKRAAGGKKFRDAFELAGDRLSRAPKGFDPEHPLVEDLKWKSYIGVHELTQAAVTRDDLPKELAKTFRAGTPFMAFLCQALGVPF
jgi:uncharacterized protein (TIGR02453 family)